MMEDFRDPDFAIARVISTVHTPVKSSSVSSLSGLYQKSFVKDT